MSWETLVCPLSTDRALVFDNPVAFSALPEELEFQEEFSPQKSGEELCSPLICHAGVYGQSTSHFMHTISDLNVTDVKRILCFYSPCRENRSGAVDLKLVFVVVEDLKPLCRLGCWELDRGGAWSSRSINCGPAGTVSGISVRISSSRSSMVAMLSDRYTCSTGCL